MRCFTSRQLPSPTVVSLSDNRETVERRKLERANVVSGSGHNDNHVGSKSGEQTSRQRSNPILLALLTVVQDSLID